MQSYKCKIIKKLKYNNKIIIYNNNNKKKQKKLKSYNKPFSS